MMRHSFRQYGEGQSPSLAPSELATPAGAAWGLSCVLTVGGVMPPLQGLRKCLLHTSPSSPFPSSRLPAWRTLPRRHLATGGQSPGRLSVRRLPARQPAELACSHPNAWPPQPAVPLPAAPEPGQPAGQRRRQRRLRACTGAAGAAGGGRGRQGTSRGLSCLGIPPGHQPPHSQLVSGCATGAVTRQAWLSQRPG